jgi:hypothetical protein
MTTKPALKRELGLRDLTLFAVTCIISARWIPIAAHAGPGSVTLWFLAAVFFMVVPPAEITKVWLFEGKLAAGTLAVVVSAWLVYRRRRPT